MSTGPRRWLAPLLAALAVLAVVAVMWQQRPGASGGDVGFADGGDSGQGSAPDSGVQPGSPGAIEPVPGPSDATAGGAGGAGGAGDGSGGVDSGAIAVTSFYRYDARHLAVNYTNGVPECYGKAGVPLVVESAQAVVITIPRIPAKSTGDRACIDIAMLDSLDVTLDEPLAGRKVLDGARDQAQVDEAAAPFSSDQAQ
jgi:hypothetical protein